MTTTVDTLLCIGGPAAGRRVSTDARMTRVILTNGGLSEAAYRREMIVGVKNTFTVWLWEHLTPDEALVELFSNFPGEGEVACPEPWPVAKVRKAP